MQKSDIELDIIGVYICVMLIPIKHYFFQSFYFLKVHENKLCIEFNLLRKNFKSAFTLGYILI